MSTSQTIAGQSKDKAPFDNAIKPPAITLPKGCDALRVIGEKFTANPVNGTSSISVPIATSPGRSGFGPQLSLSYDSGAGNGAFGLGWNLSLPSITRKIDRGLQKYQDTYQDADESNAFILSDAENLVPGGNAEDDGGHALRLVFQRDIAARLSFGGIVSTPNDLPRLSVTPQKLGEGTVREVPRKVVQVLRGRSACMTNVRHYNGK